MDEKCILRVFLDSIVKREKLFIYDCLLKCSCHKRKTVRKREEEELINQMIHDKTNIHRQSENSLFFLLLFCMCVCVFFFVFFKV